MERAAFWNLIEEARGTSEMEGALHARLVGLPREEIVSFDAWLHAYLSALRREDLWAAVYVVRGGCSDDGFDYFRGWLVSRGEAALRAVVQDPEALADLDDGSLRNEEMLGVAAHAYQAAFGETIPSAAPVVVPEALAWPADRLVPRVKWTRELLAERYPRLWAKYAAARPKPPSGEIDHAQFWEILERARAGRKADTSSATAASLVDVLAAGSVEHLIGFARWLGAYNRGLMRNDLLPACRVLVGRDDVEGHLVLRGWLIAQGETVLRRALRDPDSLADTRRDLTRGCKDVIFAVDAAAGRLKTYVGFREDTMTLPDWPPDLGAPKPSYTASGLRTLLPRLTTGRSDAFLTGPYDVESFDREERTRETERLLRLAKSDLERGADDEALARLDAAVRLEPRTAEALLARARLHSKLGRRDAALRDLDAAVNKQPRAAGLHFERARQLLALGRRDDALAEGREAFALGHLAAKAWLETASVVPPPKRVVHAKFGEGAVVSTEGQGAEQKLTIDFAVGRKTLLLRFVEVIE